tara:strand:- start:37927 stop:39069 length:1143 start_codon:yes stop_codon:yes gene_type:complete
MMAYIKSLKPILISSNYGDGKVLGQPLGVKTIGLVEIELNNGKKGYGESYVAIYVPELFKNIVNFYASKLERKKLKSPKDIYKELYIPFCSRNGLMGSVYAAIDIALWDAFCKDNQISFAEINKLKINTSKKIYWSGGSAAFPISKINKEINSLNYEIFKGYKMRIGRKSWEQDKERILTANQNLKIDNFMIDAIMGSIRPPWSFENWIEKISFINKINPLWIEEPLDPENIRDIKFLKEKIVCNIAMGEACTGYLELDSYINCKEIDILQLDFTHIGGPSSFLLNKDKIESSKKRIAMHIWGSPIAFNVNAYIGMCIDNCDWIEYPSVSLDISKNLDFDYFSAKPSLEKVAKLTGFTNFDLTKINLEEYKFIPGSGFKF